MKQIKSAIKCPEPGWIKVTRTSVDNEHQSNYSSVIVGILLGDFNGAIGDLTFSEIYLPSDSADELFQYGYNK